MIGTDSPVINPMASILENVVGCIILGHSPKVIGTDSPVINPVASVLENVVGLHRP